MAAQAFVSYRNYFLAEGAAFVFEAAFRRYLLSAADTEQITPLEFYRWSVSYDARGGSTSKEASS